MPQEKNRGNTFFGWIIYFKISSIERDENCTKASWKELIKHNNLNLIRIKEGYAGNRYINKGKKTAITDCWKSDSCLFFIQGWKLNAIIDNNHFWKIENWRGKIQWKTVHKRGLKLVKRHREPPVLLTLAVFLADLLDFPFRFLAEL